MVPVLDQNNIPLMPCSEKRARLLMERNKAKPCFQKGIFCIKLMVEPSARNYQKIAVGVDPGSKREGYTVSTEKAVVLNILTDTKNWVKDHLKTKRILRRSRRQRKTPFRKCRSNRLRNTNRIPPSTKTRWETKLNLIKYLIKLIPISVINVEDVQASTKPGQKRWNLSFSPLEVGKNWFYSELRKLGIKLILTKGFETKLARDNRGFAKSKKKLDWVWETHNVDSHILVELALNKSVEPYLGMWKIEFLEYHRRVLHRQNPSKDGVRSAYGSTISLGMPRGSILRYKNKLYYLGGTSKGKISIHSIETGKRVSRSIKKKDIKMLYTNNRRTQFLYRHKGGSPLAQI